MSNTPLRKILRQSKILFDLEKEESGSIAPTADAPISISSEGYLNPRYSNNMSDFKDANRKRKGKCKYTDCVKL